MGSFCYERRNTQIVTIYGLYSTATIYDLSAENIFTPPGLFIFFGFKNFSAHRWVILLATAGVSVRSLLDQPDTGMMVPPCLVFPIISFHLSSTVPTGCGREARRVPATDSRHAGPCVGASGKQSIRSVAQAGVGSGQQTAA